MPSFQPVKKASQNLPPMAAKKVKIVFCRGAPQGGLSCSFGAIHLLYLAENTSQAPSVHFSGSKCAPFAPRRKRRARRRLQKTVKEPQRRFLTDEKEG